MYDYVFVTHLPSFYKVNLYNELAKTLKIHVVFIGQASTIRTKDFVPSDYHFDYLFLSEGAFENRSILANAFRLVSFIIQTKYKKMVLGGWDLPEFWLAWLLNRKSLNALALESTLNESATAGLKGVIKKLFLSRVSTVFASGKSHAGLLQHLNYDGDLKITRGVGLINKPRFELKVKKYENKFLYLGRLSPEKNLELLLSVFKDLPEHCLSIVGSGPLKESLQKMASKNVNFVDHIPNDQLAALFSGIDFLILPSVSETWGLVVEESLYFGKPVIISKACGASELINSENGFQFNPESSEDLKKIILSIDDGAFQRLSQNIGKMNIDSKDREQINSYLSLKM